MKRAALSVRLWDAYVLLSRAEHAQRICDSRASAARRVGSVTMPQFWERRRRVWRNQLIEENCDAVKRIARQVSAVLVHVPVEELESDGYLGLVDAARRYKPERGDFARYAYWRIRGAMIDAHKRGAYWHERLASIEGIEEQMGFAAAHLVADPAVLPDQVAINAERRSMLALAMRELADDEQMVLMEALQGLELREIGTRQGRSVSWARTKLAAARDKVAAIVKGMQ